MNNEALTKNDLRAILQELGTPFTPLDYYPIGSYYETSDTAFNPNTAWGGTWVLEIEGVVHVSAGTNYAVNHANDNDGVGVKDDGEPTHTLTTEEIPSHRHKQQDMPQYISNRTLPSGNYTLSDAKAATQNTYTTYTGGGQAHNNMPPYIVVNRWHRMA